MAEDTEETPDMTWGDLKKYISTLTDEQLQQTVKVDIADDSLHYVQYASELGDDHYFFPEFDYSTPKEHFDADCMPDAEPPVKTFEEAIAQEEYVIIPKTNIYLFSE